MPDERQKLGRSYRTATAANGHKKPAAGLCGESCRLLPATATNLISNTHPRVRLEYDREGGTSERPRSRHSAIPIILVDGICKDIRRGFSRVSLISGVHGSEPTTARRRFRVEPEA